MSESRMTVRMPEELYNWLTADAADVPTSLNSHVVAILKEYRRLNDTSLKDRVDELERQVTELRSKLSP